MFVMRALRSLVLSGIAGLFACGVPVRAQAPNDAMLPKARQLALNQTQYRVRAGERVAVDALSETRDFLWNARTRSARSSSRRFAIAPTASGEQVLLGVPLTTPPGEYSVTIVAMSESGEKRTVSVAVTVDPLQAVQANASAPPVVLLDGWQQPSLSSPCPMYSDSTQTFGMLQSYLTQSPNLVPAVYFFENCTECPNCPIEELGASLGTFLNSIQYTNGTPVPAVDVIAHSMGGLIVRCYLSGKQQTSGVFSPPLVPKIRKSVFIATPHLGSFQADSTLADIAFGLGNQTNEMKRGSQFLWDLATWNQFRDDLRGTDALAIIGSLGSYPSSPALANATDGVVALTSASLDFVRPGRTRIVNYCHVDLSPGLEADYLGCTGSGIADIKDMSHPTYQILSNFLMNGSSWQSIGTAPTQDPYLAKYGGMIVADINSANQYITGLSGISWGSVNLTNGAAFGQLFYNDFASGTGTFNFGTSTCGPYTVTAGVYSTVRCKSAPVIYSVGPPLSSTNLGVQSGTNILITGAGFGSQQCATCGVTASNPQFTPLRVSSWSNTSIQAFLPATFAGVATIGVTASNGSDAINIIAAPGLVTLTGKVTLSGAGVSGVTVTLSGSQNGSTVTDASGNYSFSGLTIGGNYTVTPALAGYTITPPNQMFASIGANETANFTATAIANNVVISGQVNGLGGGLGGVTINVNGTQTTSTLTTASGNYSIQLPQGGTYTLSAALSGYSFSAPVTFANLSTNQTVNFTGTTVAGLEFFAVTPCRLVDTRVPSFPSGFGPPSMMAGQTRTFSIPSNTACGIPSTAAAYSLNITVVTKGYLGILTIWPAGQPMPNASTLNSYSTTSTAVANAAIVPAGTNGAINVYATDATDLIIDINGYFLSANNGLEFYPVTPCRLVDTRVSSFPSGFGPPTMTAGSTRTFTIPSDGACTIPSSAQAYSLNITAVPQKTLGFLSIWPTGQPLPNVSTLNVYTAGTVVANAAIVPAGVNGAINAYVTDATDLVIDINGYFAPGTNGLKLYPMTPCRIADTRVSSFPTNLGPPSMTAGSQRSFPVPQSTCGVPTGAGAYSFNFTAVPHAPQLGIFITWPTGVAQPNVSTMNSYNGSVVANAAIVPAGTNGAISIYVTDLSDVLFDINAYFAP